MVMSYFQGKRPECSIESVYTTKIHWKGDCSNEDGFRRHGNTVFEAMGCFYHYWLCQEARPGRIQEDIQLGSENGELSERQKRYIDDSTTGLMYR